MATTVKTTVNDINTTYTRGSYARVAKIHKYWSRKPWYIIDQYINKYSKTGDTVIDPFMGSGSAGLEAILLNRDFIGIDLNPSSLFVAEATMNLSFDEQALAIDMDKLEKTLKEEIMNLYSLGGNKDEFILYSIQGPKNSNTHNAVLTDFLLGQKTKASIEKKYIWPTTKLPKSIKYPDALFPKKFYKDRFSYKGVSRVSDLFSARNLYALSLLNKYISQDESASQPWLKLALSNTLLHVSKLKSERVRPLGVNNYWIPDDYIEENVWWRFIDRLSNVVSAKKAINTRINDQKILDIGKHKLLKQSALDMRDIDSGSVDYMFTDPPYGEAVQYSELSFIWNCWLQEKYDTEEEVIINPVQKKDIVTFNQQMDLFVKEAYRVLKPGKYLTLCFQNKEVRVWSDLSKLIRSSGFELVDISVFDTLGSPYNANWAKFSPKSDFYITFIKSSVGAGKFSDPIHIDDIFAEITHSQPTGRINPRLVYNLFVASVIKHTFLNKDVVGISKLDLKSIARRLEGVSPHGNTQQRLL